MGELLNLLKRSKWGVAGLFAAASGVVAAGLASHESSEVQAGAAAAVVVVSLGAAKLAPALVALVKERLGKTDEAAK